MRWTNKIMHGNHDQNTSGLSSRSLSKFKKVKLQKSQAEISSNHDQLQKSQLKLNSVEKIKHTHFHRSCIANYIGLSSGQSKNQRLPMEMNVAIKDFQLINLTQQKQKNIMLGKYQNGVNRNYVQEGRQQFQGLGFFHQDKIIFNKDKNPQYRPYQQDIQQHDNSPQVKLQNILSRMHQLLQDFKQASLIIKSNLTSSTLIAFQMLHSNLNSSIETFEKQLENGINQLIQLKNNQINTLDLHKIIENDLNSYQKDGSQSLYKIKYLEHEQIYHHEKQKQQRNNRPYSFKNKFKQMLVDSDQNVLMKKCEIETKIVHQTNRPKEKQTKKLSRKRTIPTPRVNSLLDNDSSICNEESLQQDHNTSINSIKYLKMNDRSASRSVQKLQQKIAVIKNIFKPENTKDQQENSQTIHKVTSKY